MNKLKREVIVMPESEHKKFMKLVRYEKKPKSRVAREALIDKYNLVLDKVANK